MPAKQDHRTKSPKQIALNCELCVTRKEPAALGFRVRGSCSSQRQPGENDDSLFAFAGLWERWRDPAGELLETCTILTTKPNALVADVHDRMPAILATEDYDLWLDPGVTDPARIADCVKPFDPRLMKKYPVSARVNRPENDGPECAQEVPIAFTAQTLF